MEPVGKLFARARELARRADAGKRMPESHVVAFEEAGDLLALLSQKRVQLLRSLQQEPGSIADLARGRIHLFSLDVLMDMAMIAGLSPHIAFKRTKAPRKRSPAEAPVFRIP